MRLFIDRDACCATGMCGAIAPEHIEFGDDGRPIVVSGQISADALEAVESAVHSCPTAALRLDG